MNRIDLPIAIPCEADWTTMTLADRGRFCGACGKVVSELERMTESEARVLLASPPTVGLCVRYLHDERGEIKFRQDDVRAAGDDSKPVPPPAPPKQPLRPSMGAPPRPVDRGHELSSAAASASDIASFTT